MNTGGCCNERYAFDRGRQYRRNRAGQKRNLLPFCRTVRRKVRKGCIGGLRQQRPGRQLSANRELLLEAGVGQVALLPLTEQPDLVGRNSWTNRADQSLLPVLEGAGGIWFGGGDQLRTARLLLQTDGTDTPVLAAMRRLLDGGGVIGGSSAGAAIMSRIMIARGDDEGALTLPLCTDARAWQDHSEGLSPEPLLISRGLGFLPHGIVDQHFNRRARLQRLMTAMEASNEAQGFGISEDTALEVSLPDGTFRVLGSAYVMHLTRKDGRFTIEKLAAAHSAVQ